MKHLSQALTKSGSYQQPHCCKLIYHSDQYSNEQSHKLNMELSCSCLGESIVHTFHIFKRAQTLWYLSWQRKFPDLSKVSTMAATGSDKITVVDLQKLSPELFPNLAKFFNHYPKKKCFPSLRKVSAVCSVFKNVGKCSSLSQYQPISLFSVMNKLSL